jgi:hypothetical protein
MVFHTAVFPQMSTIFPTTQQFRKAVMLSHAGRTVFDYLRPRTIPFGDLGVSASENIRIYTVSLLSCPWTRQLSRDVSADAGFSMWQDHRS